MKPIKSRPFVIYMATSALLLLGMLLAWSAASPVARAGPADLFVTPTGSGTSCAQSLPCLLQTALAQAASGDTIYLAAGTYTGSGAAVVTIAESISLYGGWDGSAAGSVVRDPNAHPTVLDGEGARRVVYIHGPLAPVLDGLVIQHGSAVGLGGYSTYDAGGGVYIQGADAVMSHCTIINNDAGPASDAGNGIGGGVALVSSDAQLTDNLITHNMARWGGGVRVIYGAPVFRRNQFVSNTSLFGGGMYVMGSAALVEGNSFHDNVGSHGGGLYSSNSEATIVANVIRDNQGRFGGGIGINLGRSAVVAGNLILGNEAGDRGGGIDVSYNDTDAHNNVIAGNQAPTAAGVYVTQASPLFRHNTVVGNNGGDGVGVFVGPGATMALTNTIVASHTVGITVTAGSSATLEATLWGSGLWANLADWGGDGAILTGAVNVWGDPALLDPDGADYHIGPGSAARDAGVDAGVMIDIDGDGRPQGSGYDIGADEFRLPWQTYLPLVLKKYR
jgi:hypothetical protein